MDMGAQDIGTQDMGAQASRLQTDMGTQTSRLHGESAGGTPALPCLQKQKRQEAWASVPNWRSRGYLPHCDEIGRIQSITFRLADSVPAKTIAKWRDELKIIPGLAAYDPRHIELRRRMDEYEDAGYGDCWLRHPQIAELVQNALLYFDGERYRLLEWCIMPNHVHELLLPSDGHSLASIVHSWKSYTGHEAKKILNLTKPFWMVEYYDRFIRNDRHLEIVRNYIRQNPVAANLVQKAEDWAWSSAVDLGAQASRLQKDMGTQASRLHGGSAGDSSAGGTPALPCPPCLGASE